MIEFFRKMKIFHFLLASEISISYDAHFLSDYHPMKFYIDGLQVDVQDPSFFIDEDYYQESKESLDEMLTTYVNLPVAP